MWVRAQLWPTRHIQFTGMTYQPGVRDMNRGANFKRGIFAAAMLMAIGSGAANAATLRMAGANDILTTDPM